MYYLVQILGQGAPLRAFEELTRLYELMGGDPVTPVGAYFFLSGWGVGKETIRQRQFELQYRHGLSYSTSRRRADEGASELVTIIRDRDETYRPWAFISIFQERNHWHPFLDFNLGTESWLPPEVSINGAAVDVEFTFRHDHESGTRWFNRTILPEQDLNLGVEFAGVMGTLRVEWPMPVWPLWQLVAWVADPRILTQIRTFRQRAVDVSLKWWDKNPPSSTAGLAGSSGLWADRPEPRAMSLPTEHGDESRTRPPD